MWPSLIPPPTAFGNNSALHAFNTANGIPIYDYCFGHSSASYSLSLFQMQDKENLQLYGTKHLSLWNQLAHIRIVSRDTKTTELEEILLLQRILTFFKSIEPQALLFAERIPMFDLMRCVRVCLCSWRQWNKTMRQCYCVQVEKNWLCESSVLRVASTIWQSKPKWRGQSK